MGVSARGSLPGGLKTDSQPGLVGAVDRPKSTRGTED